jgi:hypothetical protein
MKSLSSLLKGILTLCILSAGIFTFSACEENTAQPEPDVPAAGIDVEVEVYIWNLPDDLNLTPGETQAYIDKLVSEEDFQYATLDYRGTRDGYNMFLATQPKAEQSNCSPWIKTSCCCTEWAYSSYCYGYCSYQQSCQNPDGSITTNFKTERVFDSCGNF